MRTAITLALGVVAFLLPGDTIRMHLRQSFSIDSLGACQGASWQQGRLFLYGDREVGIIREYKMDHDTLVCLHKEYRLTQHDTDVINHPTGIAWNNGQGPTFIGNSIRLNKEGTRWKAMIYCIDWKGLQRTGTLDGNLLNTIEDDTCVQGTRPEYVQYNNKWYVATADYGGVRNEVRLYDPQLLAHARKTSEKSVLVKKFTCTPWVQNLLWVPARGVLVLVQNQIEGRRWRFTYVDLKKSIEAGTQQVLGVADIDRGDELEGFTLLGAATKGLAVSSSRRDNVNTMDLTW